MNIKFASRTGWAFDELRTHEHICWDMDETLVDSEASELLHEFILQNPQIHHTIVTFRCQGHEKHVWSDLAEYALAPTEQHFKGLYYPSELMNESYVTHRSRRLREKLDPALVKAETDYLEWKGSICALVGATALVDDLTEMVEKGCRKHGIRLFHPLQFLQ